MVGRRGVLGGRYVVRNSRGRLARIENRRGFLGDDDRRGVRRRRIFRDDGGRSVRCVYGRRRFGLCASARQGGLRDPHDDRLSGVEFCNLGCVRCDAFGRRAAETCARTPARHLVGHDRLDVIQAHFGGNGAFGLADRLDVVGRDLGGRDVVRINVLRVVDLGCRNVGRQRRWQTREHTAGLFAVVEVTLLAPHDLVTLVAFARDDDDIVRLGPRERLANRFASFGLDDVALGLDGPAHLRETTALKALGDLRDDLVGVLGPRVVVCNDREVGVGRNGRAHLRSFGLVAITAAAEHDDQSPLGHRSKRLQHVFQRVRRVRVVHKHAFAVFVGDRFEAPRHSLEAAKPANDARFAETHRQRHAHRDEHIRNVVPTDQRTVEFPLTLRCANDHRRAVEGAVHRQRDDVTFAVRVHRHTQGLAAPRRDQLFAVFIVDIHDRHTTARPTLAKRLREQPRLGAQVRLDGLVIVEVVVRQIRETGDLEVDASDALLVERVARHFHHHVSHAAVAHFGEGAL